MREFESCFAEQLRSFVSYREASQKWNESSYGPNLLLFDRFCYENYPDATSLTQEMIDGWCSQRETETNNSCRSRIYVVYSFVEFLITRNMALLNLPELPRQERSTFVPYAFSEEEITKFFAACDSMPAFPRNKNVLVNRLTVPVFFRLLYSSGIRTTEARLLERKDADLKNGVLNIRYSKGRDQHYIVLHDSMLDLMKQYDDAIQEWFPHRTVFFPTPDDKPHPRSWVQKNFRKVWSTVSDDRRATAYAFRHHYAITNINRWIGEGLSFEDKLLYLSKSMDHSTIESTRYYYSIVPGLSDVILEKTECGFNDIVPEVWDEE